QPENALTREEAIRGMTIWAAKADFLEKEIGSLQSGKRADFVVLDRDLMEVPAAEVLSVRPLATYASGVKVYGSK
ncbi:MAG TPA: amidohydrolase family protein, partial [Puia sp.]|nr:amidohydrolase family protein [Puia sp.]